MRRPAGSSVRGRGCRSPRRRGCSATRVWRSATQQERTIRDDLYTEDAYAWALYRAGRIEAARVATDRATALGTPDARLLYHAGAIRLAGGDGDAGRALIRAALELNPTFDLTGSAEARRVVASTRAALRAAR